MELDEKLYKAFLEEMHELESFRIAYASELPGVPLERDDPDVKRMIEALAFFAARTRMTAVRKLDAGRRRLLRQLLPYLLDPLPAMAMLQAVPTGRFAEAAFLPRGTEIAIWSDGGRSATFRTLRELRLLPLSVERLSLLPLADGGLRFVLPFSAPYPRSDEIGRMGLYINYFNDFHGSLRVQHALRQHLRRAAVTFEDKVDDSVKGTPCTVSFGQPPDGDELGAPHPLADERLYFHFPRAELFLNVDVPTPPRHWQRFTLLFDVGPDWPKGLRLTKDVFYPFATPVANLHRALAQPIVHDGTRAEWPIRHPAMAGGFAIHSVLGVYRSVGESLVPLRPGPLAASGGSYEIDDDPRGKEGARMLHLHLPDDFENPATISVEAEWLQPWFASSIGQKLQAAPYRQSFMGLGWELIGEPAPHFVVETGCEDDDFTQVLVLQNKPRLDRDDLLALLQALGTVWTGAFAPLRNLVAGLTCREVPLQRAGGNGGSKLLYELELHDFDAGLEPLVERFVVHVGKILDAWIAQAPVELRRAERRG